MLGDKDDLRVRPDGGVSENNPRNHELDEETNHDTQQDNQRSHGFRFHAGSGTDNAESGSISNGVPVHFLEKEVECLFVHPEVVLAEGAEDHFITRPMPL